VLLNVSSVAAHWNPVVQPAYSTSKMAFTHMLQAIATEVPADKCQMLSFNPGALWTPGAANVGFDKAAIAWDDSKSWRSVVSSRGILTA
jgi:NAD(P)-dependent dehydrogenase (short-subunit alcohol dehydrogenase family)